jgi:riboflavin biosynthesis pyrimidine reductase
MTLRETVPGRIDLKGLLSALGKRSVTSLLIEGGAAVITTVLKEALADRLVVVVAPKIIGKGIEAVGNLGLSTMDQAIRLSKSRITRKGEELIYDMRFQK